LSPVIRWRALLSLCALIAVASGARAAEDADWVGAFFPYRQFAQLPATRIEVGGGTLEVAFAPGPLDLSHDCFVARARHVERQWKGELRRNRTARSDPARDHCAALTQG
jgi:hypothetical protein